MERCPAAPRPTHPRVSQRLTLVQLKKWFHRFGCRTGEIAPLMYGCNCTIRTRTFCRGRRSLAFQSAARFRPMGAQGLDCEKLSGTGPAGRELSPRQEACPYPGTLD